MENMEHKESVDSAGASLGAEAQEEKKQEKLFTQEEVNRIVSERLARERQKAQAGEKTEAEQKMDSEHEKKSIPEETPEKRGDAPVKYIPPWMSGRGENIKQESEQYAREHGGRYPDSRELAQARAEQKEQDGYNLDKIPQDGQLHSLSEARGGINPGMNATIRKLFGLPERRVK